MVAQTTEKIKIFALGGVGEVGKNMYIVEINNDIFVLDTGLMLPEGEMLGVDFVIPDITYLIENRNRIKAILLSHGHVDHIGALPYVLQEIKVPVYGTRLTIGLAKQSLKKSQGRAAYDFKIINPDEELIIGSTTFTFFRVNHSIPDSIGICIHTSQGAIVYTGDFKFDQTPVNSELADFNKLAQIGASGVLCLLSDSMNAEKLGTTPSDALVGQQILEVFSNAEGRVITATFASNIHRIQQVFEAADQCGRKVAISGKELLQIVEIAKQLNHLHFVDDALIPLKDLHKYPDDELAILTAGNQGEPIAALYHMATNTDKNVKLKQSDTVIIAATSTLGNELLLSQTIDALSRIGTSVVADKSGVHVSGHGSQEELKLMINLVNPTYFIPIHGEFRMQKAHRDLARQCGVDEKNIFIIEKGDVIEFANGQAKKGGKVPSGQVLIDGLGIGDVGNIVLRDRRLLSQDGILIVVVTLDRKNYRIVSGPEIISRGFVYVRESEKLLQTAQQEVTTVLEKCMHDKVNDWTSLKAVTRDSLSSLLYERTKRRPMIMPIIMEI